MNQYQLYKTLFVIKDFLIKNDLDGFRSFDLTNNPNQEDGKSFKVRVRRAEDVMFFLKFYNLLGNLTKKDINELHKSKGFDSLEIISLELFI